MFILVVMRIHTLKIYKYCEIDDVEEKMDEATKETITQYNEIENENRIIQNIKLKYTPEKKLYVNK
jgi:hypothetical protein